MHRSSRVPSFAFFVEYDIYFQKIELWDSFKIGIEGKILQARDFQPCYTLESPGKLLKLLMPEFHHQDSDFGWCRALSRHQYF